MQITFNHVKNSKKTVWDLGNRFLYELCEKNFTHTETEKIIAKVWIIGRTYSVALERRKNKAENNDTFYKENIVNVFKKSEIDNKMLTLKKSSQLLNENIGLIIETHKYLTDELKLLTEQEKRSFSSKYLHFHLPNLFYIYDSRASLALNKIFKKIPIEYENLILKIEKDKVYSHFFLKCIMLEQKISKEFNINLSPRQIDNLLIEIANEEST